LVVKRDALVVLLLWLTLTVIGEVIAVFWDYQPLAAAKEADVVDDAFFVLVVLAVPVVAFVVATVLYSVLRFGRRKGGLEDGPPVRSNSKVLVAWFLATAALTILVIIFPGTIGLLDLRDHSPPDGTDGNQNMVVQVEGSRWVWKITYPEQSVTSYGELVLPAGRQVRFEVTATDVIHAFWVPAFRMKIDAVPGQVTTVYATPNKTGAFGNDSGYRLQCAELCGLGHSLMMVPVRVVESAEFEAWAAQQTPTASLNP
jgi:cytochrome c oxidase subunit 2